MEVNGRWVVIGLGSWSYSCGKAEASAMFTKVSEFMYMIAQDLGMFSFVSVDIFP